MLVPFLGLVLGIAFFSGVGWLVLRLRGVRPRRLWILAAFVVAALPGGLLYAMIYGALFGGADGQLHSAAAVLGLLLGMPVAGTLAGWFAARSLAARARAAGAT